MTRQRKPEETYCNFANFKWAVDSKTSIKQNGVQIIKNLSRIYESKLIIYFCFLRILTLKSTSRLSDFDLISAPFLCLGFPVAIRSSGIFRSYFSSGGFPVRTDLADRLWRGPTNFTLLTSMDNKNLSCP